MKQRGQQREGSGGRPSYHLDAYSFLSIPRSISHRPDISDSQFSL